MQWGSLVAWGSGFGAGKRGGGSAPADPLAGVAKDAASNKYFPATVAQWDTLLTAAGSSGAPSVILLCQEPSGDLADSSGNAITFTASGTGVTYQSPVAGYTRVGVAVADGVTAMFATTNALLPDISTTSLAVMTVQIISTPPGTFRNVHNLGTSTRVSTYAKSGPELQMYAGANGTTLSGVDPTGQVRVFITQIDRTNSVERLITNQEVLTPVFAATPTGKSVEIAGGANGAPGATTIYSALFFGAAANKTPSVWKTIMQTMNFPVSY